MKKFQVRGLRWWRRLQSQRKLPLQRNHRPRKSLRLLLPSSPSEIVEEEVRINEKARG
jgi:hypothetical protein